LTAQSAPTLNDIEGDRTCPAFDGRIFAEAPALTLSNVPIAETLRLAILREEEIGVEGTVDEEELPPDWWMEALLAETCYIEAAVEKGREITEGYNRRGESELQDPEVVVRTLNRWLQIDLSQSLLVNLSAVGHLEMEHYRWEICFGGTFPGARAACTMSSGK
jgi:hypothetical protein